MLGPDRRHFDIWHCLFEILIFDIDPLDIWLLTLAFKFWHWYEECWKLWHWHWNFDIAIFKILTIDLCDFETITFDTGTPLSGPLCHSNMWAASVHLENHTSVTVSAIIDHLLFIFEEKTIKYSSKMKSFLVYKPSFFCCYIRE